MCNQDLVSNKAVDNLVSSCDMLGKTDLWQCLQNIRDENNGDNTCVYLLSCQKTTYNKVKSLNNKSYNHVPESPKTILPSDSIVTFDFTCAEKM